VITGSGKSVSSFWQFCITWRTLLACQCFITFIFSDFSDSNMFWNFQFPGGTLNEILLDPHLAIWGREFEELWINQ
jgi:hypothetical protein